MEFGHVRLARPLPSLISSKRCSPRRTLRSLELAAAPYRLSEIYPELLKISVDYAVMEPVSRGEGSARVVAVRLPITWHDVGGFAALGEQLPRDENGQRHPRCLGTGRRSGQPGDQQHRGRPSRCGRWTDRHSHRADPADHPRLSRSPRRNGSRNWSQRSPPSSAAATRSATARG